MDLKATIDNIIVDTYKMCNITTFPFDCIKVLEMYGYKCKKYSSLNDKKKQICMNVSEDACLIDGIIYYNDAKQKSRIYFTLMHELGHIVLNHKVKNDIEENEADYFASCILAPRIMIHQLRLNNKCSRVTADDIHDYFGISISASNRAITDYNKWFKNIANTTRKPSDKEIELKELFVESKKPVKPRNVIQNIPHYRYILDPANTDYFAREMERKRTEPY